MSEDLFEPIRARIAALERDLDEARNLKSAALQEMAEIERAHDKRYELMEELERDLAEAKRPRCDNPLHDGLMHMVGNTSAGSAQAGTVIGASTDAGAGRPADALLPCPFCGGKPILHENACGLFFVDCANAECGVGTLENSLAGTIAGWNRRAIVPRAEPKQAGPGEKA